MFCRKCGTQLDDNAIFCHKCGTKVESTDLEPQIFDTRQEADEGLAPSPIEIQSNGQDSSETENEKSNRLTGKEILIAIIALPIVVLVLRKFWVPLVVILIIASFIFVFLKGSQEEKKDAKKTLIQFAAIIAAAVIFSFILVTKPDIITNTIQPGAEVRSAYLSKYSDKVTIEEAFNNFFDNEKWSTYKSEGYSYVVFSGACEYLDERVDAQITFKITGENFRVERLDINGEEQNDLILALLLAKVYEEYQ